MSGYLIPGLTADQKQTLTEHGIKFVDWKGNVPGHIVIQECDKKALLTALKMTAISKRTRYCEHAVLCLTPLDEDGKGSLYLTTRQQYIDACSARVERAVRKAKDTLNNEREQLTALQPTVIDELRQNSMIDPSCLVDHCLRQADIILKMELVQNVQVTPNAVRIYTKTLTITDPETFIVHSLGRFRIEIYLDGTNDAIRWFNLTRRVKGISTGMNAPQVDAHGKGQLTEIRTTLIELIAHCQLADAVSLAIQYLQYCDNEEQAMQVCQWPVHNSEETSTDNGS